MGAARTENMKVEKPKSGDVLTIVGGKGNNLQIGVSSPGTAPANWCLTVNPGDANGYRAIIEKAMKLFGQPVADWSYSIFRDKTLWGPNKEWLGKEIGTEIKFSSE